VNLIAKPAEHMKQEAVMRKDKMFCVKAGMQVFYVWEKINFLKQYNLSGTLHTNTNANAIEFL